MLRIAVFGIGRGGEAVAKYLSMELNIVDVIEVIDWTSPDGVYDNLDEMYHAASYFLSPYIGKVDLIVLADYALSLVAHSLKAKWPKQKIIGMEVDFRRIPKSCQRANVVTLLTSELLLQSDLGRDIYRQMSCADILIPDCSGWEMLIDTGEMSKDILRAELSPFLDLTDNFVPEPCPAKEYLSREPALRAEIISFLMRANMASRPQFAIAGVNDMNYGEIHHEGSEETEISPTQNDYGRSTDALYLLDTHFWNIKQELQDLLGYGTMIIDFRQKLLHDVCLSLKLRGVDGRLGE